MFNLYSSFSTTRSVGKSSSVIHFFLVVILDAVKKVGVSMVRSVGFLQESDILDGIKINDKASISSYLGHTKTMIDGPKLNLPNSAAV